MSTIRDEFEALLPQPFDHLYEFASPFGGTTLRESASEYNGNRPKRSIALYTAEQMRAMFDAATERAAKQERDKADELLTALKDLSQMYAHAWDLVDGGLTMIGESVPLFESKHKAASKAIERYEAAAIRAKGGEAK